MSERSLAGTVVLTTILAGSQGLRLTRMNIPYLLGTMFTPNRDRASLVGVLIHLANGFEIVGDPAAVARAQRLPEASHFVHY